VRLACSRDPESYADGSIATGKVSHAGQVKGEEPDEKGYAGPPGWGLGISPTITQEKKKKSMSIEPQRYLVRDYK
jgi:hypothetical protein